MFIHGIGTIHKLKSTKIHHMIQDVFVEHYAAGSKKVGKTISSINATVIKSH